MYIIMAPLCYSTLHNRSIHMHATLFGIFIIFANINLLHGKGGGG